MKRHRGGLAGVLLLMLIVSLSLCVLLSVWWGGSRYLQAELSRMGYGNLTAWVSGLPHTSPLVEELGALPQVEKVGVQPLLFASYRIGEQESDSEGQLIGYDAASYPYRFFDRNQNGYLADITQIAPGEIYLPPSLISTFGVGIGDSVIFPLARGGQTRSFTVAGWFEDPFMGSSMIGMKSFLVNPSDLAALTAQAQSAGIDALARGGAMLHIYGNGIGTAELSSILNSTTRLPQFSEFTHSSATISGFMLVMQNALTGFLLAFVAVLLVVTVIVLGHSIGSAIEQDTRNLGILKSMGFTAAKLQQVQVVQYLSPILAGMALGLLGAVPLTGIINQQMVTTTGLLLPNRIPLGLCGLVFAGILAVLVVFLLLKTAAIGRITPLRAIHNADAATGTHSATPIAKRGLPFWMALRQLATGKRQYVSACVVAVLLVFFASLMGRLNVWLGPNGEGMMDAFNPADLNLAVQPLGEVDMSEVETMIAGISPIVDGYELAMPSVAANGVDLTANVITQPERFHLLSGRTSAAADEVVLTESVAADLGVAVGDSITLSAGAGSGDFTVTGIYQCANDMGANLGMSREGYARIGADNPQMWCKHYFLSDPDRQPEVIAALDVAYGHDLHIHENSWPGLGGILAAMQMLLTLMYAVVAVFVFVVTTLVGSKLLAKEQRDLGVYKALGFSTAQMRFAFALRFAVVAVLGAGVGVLLSSLGTDPLVAAVMRLCGISNFSSHPGLGSVLLPAAAVFGLFTILAYLSAAKIKRVSLATLTAE